MDLIPVGVDISRTGNIDLEQLENLPLDLKAIMVVHMHGEPLDMTRLMKWARNRNIRVIEDCSQAHGAKSDGIPVGTYGDVGVFSCYPTKNLPAAGDAGIVVTNNQQIALDIRAFCNYGSNPSNKYAHETFGVNSRLDPIQAAILSVNLKYLDEWNTRRREVAAYYLNSINNKKIEIIHQSITNSVYHHFIVRTEDRDGLRCHLAADGILTEIHYPLLASDEWAKIVGEEEFEFKSARQFSSSTLSLPLYPWLPEEDMKNVVASINRF
jgi:dTDP-4-amino-4,6-dideoxygalactose transaminase